MTELDAKTLLADVADLKREVGRLRAESEIRRLQYLYGYYDDYRDWDRLLGLFADDDCSVDIGSRGRYVGKERLSLFFREIIGGNRSHLIHNEIYNHLQLQMVITVDDDLLHAKGRSRALIQGAPGGGPAMVWAEGVYENTFVVRDGAWKIQHMRWSATFYAKVSGIEALMFSGAPASQASPPDAPPPTPDPVVGRALVPYHF
jgi:hypothetical protein